MGMRQREWARKERRRLQIVLGARCVLCGGGEQLTFDCIRPANDGHHHFELARRISYYRREMRRGNVQLLCHFCNSCKAGLNPEEWRLVRCWVSETNAIHSASNTPGRGTCLTSLELRECLATAVSRVYASRAKRLAI